ncbi:hypothetical protein B5F07_21305 [Lachnoclostridium sp. An169]|nr:hypothetical protein B5F07_21305 [Lachnoclostridium sp. An169]
MFREQDISEYFFQRCLSAEFLLICAVDAIRSYSVSRGKAGLCRLCCAESDIYRNISNMREISYEKNIFK